MAHKVQDSITFRTPFLNTYILVHTKYVNMIAAVKIKDGGMN